MHWLLLIFNWGISLPRCGICECVTFCRRMFYTYISSCGYCLKIPHPIPSHIYLLCLCLHAMTLLPALGLLNLLKWAGVSVSSPSFLLLRTFCSIPLAFFPSHPVALSSCSPEKNSDIWSFYLQIWLICRDALGQTQLDCRSIFSLMLSFVVFHWREHQVSSSLESLFNFLMMASYKKEIGLRSGWSLFFFSGMDNHLFPVDACSCGAHKGICSSADGWLIKFLFTDSIVVPIALCISRYMCIMHACMHDVLFCSVLFFLGLMLFSCSCYAVAWLRLLSDYIEQLKPLHMTGLNVKRTSLFCVWQSFCVLPAKATTNVLIMISIK